MPRQKSIRRLAQAPVIKGLRAFGNKNSSSATAVFLLLEEYEALKLCDYDQKNHAEACTLMHVSRPTFTRIYASARAKVATALAEGRDLIIEGGKVYLDSSWYVCMACGSNFNHQETEGTAHACPLCGDASVRTYEPLPVRMRRICRCRRCGFQHRHETDESCAHTACPDCAGEISVSEEPFTLDNNEP